MRRLPLVLVALAMIAAPGSLVAQEEDEDESPMTLRLSFFMCNTNRIDEALEEVESQDIPVWQELVDEGMVESYGHIVHSWASEWNIGIYTVAESIDHGLGVAEDLVRARVRDRGEERAEVTPVLLQQGPSAATGQDGVEHAGLAAGDDHGVRARRVEAGVG